jgi:hypothetical protein
MLHGHRRQLFLSRTGTCGRTSGSVTDKRRIAYHYVFLQAGLPSICCHFLRDALAYGSMNSNGVDHRFLTLFRLLRLVRTPVRSNNVVLFCFFFFFFFWVNVHVRIRTCM